jgi:multidrug efflux pump
MKGFIDASLSHVRTTLSILVMILVAGFYSYVSIPKESQPDVDIPQVYISMYLEGISPEDSERLLLRPVEQALSKIEGVKEMKASAYQGGGFVLLEFIAGFNKEKAMQDVRDEMDKVRRDLPDSMDGEPNITEVNFSLFPVLVVTLSGDLPERTLLQYAKELQDKIEALPPVLEAAIAGNREELVEIVVSPTLMQSYHLDGLQILDFYNRSNRLVAAGNLDTGVGSFSVEMPGLFQKAADILSMPVRTDGDSTILLRDIAEVRRGFKDPENYARLNGERTVALEIVKRSGENVIDTIAAVKAVVEDVAKDYPASLQINFTQDSSEEIRTMLSDLQNNVISAVLLVMLVVVASLGMRTSLIIAVSVPGSFLAGILIISLMGLTVNVVVLFSLIMAVGMLVDGAIIVTEYADRKMVEGLSKKESYREAAHRMAWPVISSISTTLAAFAPLLFWPGIIGEFMKYLPITLIAVMGASLFMALIFVPALGSLFGKPGTADPKQKANLEASETGDVFSIEGVTGHYVRALDFILRHAGKVVLASILSLVMIQVAYAKWGQGVEFFPHIEPDMASILVHARGNLSIEEKDALASKVEARILNTEGVKTVYTRTGKAASQGANLAQDVIGQFQLEFLPWNMRPTAAEILNQIRVNTADIAGIKVETQEREAGPPGGKDIQIQLSSRYPHTLGPATIRLRDYLDSTGDYTAIEDDLPLPGITWEMTVDRAQASKFGLDISTIGSYVRMVTNGLKITEYRPDDSDEEIDIVLRHNTHERTLDQLDNVNVQTQAGPVPISNFVERRAIPSQGVIHRSDQRRIMMIKADLIGDGNVTAHVEMIRQHLKEHPEILGQDVDVSFRGQDEDQKEAQEFLMKAFVMAVFIMTIIMVTQFNSFYSAFLVMSAVIMSTIGVFLGLLITQEPFGIVMSGIGIISLAGIIVSNNIILIDTYDVIRKQHAGKMSTHEMLLRTGAQRLRPVYLTVMTTVLGLLPMVFQISIDFINRDVSVGAPSTQWWVQLSTAVSFGLCFATILTLFVTPAALMLKENIILSLSKIKTRS